MPTATKLIFNCTLVVALVVLGVLAFVSLPQFMLEPLQWAGRKMEGPGPLAFWFAYAVLIWAMIAAVIAWLMLRLKPRNVALYGAVAFLTFVTFGGGWALVLQGNVYGSSRELVFALTVPLLYWMFARWSGNGPRQPSKAVDSHLAAPNK